MIDPQRVHPSKLPLSVIDLFQFCLIHLGVMEQQQGGCGRACSSLRNPHTRQLNLVFSRRGLCFGRVRVARVDSLK